MYLIIFTIINLLYINYFNYYFIYFVIITNEVITKLVFEIIISPFIIIVLTNTCYRYYNNNITTSYLNKELNYEINILVTYLSSDYERKSMYYS